MCNFKYKKQVLQIVGCSIQMLELIISLAHLWSCTMRLHTS